MEETQSSGTTAEEIDLLDLMKKIWARRIFVLKAAGIGAIAGLIIAFSIPKEYTTTVKMAPEGINATKGGGMADLAALAGFDLSSGSGNNVDGINLMLYPDVVNSTPFMVDLSQIPVQGKKMPATMSLYDYVDTQLSSPWWKYLLAVPGKIIGWISFAEKEEEANGINPYALTQQQSEVLKKQNERINISVDKKTGVITASATMQDPLVTAAVADSIFNKLQEYILTYRTGKPCATSPSPETFSTRRNRNITARSANTRLRPTPTNTSPNRRHRWNSIVYRTNNNWLSAFTTNWPSNSKRPKSRCRSKPPA